MARLTIASLTTELVEQGISLTKETKGGYRVVMNNGFSFWEPTLVVVKERVDLEIDIQRRANILVEQLSNVQTQPTEAEIFCVQSTRVNQLASLFTEEELNDLTMIKPETSLAEDEEELGAELVRQADERREHLQLKQMDADTDYELIDMLTQMENDRKDAEGKAILEAIGNSFVYQSNRSKQNHSAQIGRGFQTNTPRVSAKLQRRANRFYHLLAAA